MKGHVRRREGKRGATWTYIFDLPRDPLTGDRNQKWVGGFKTKTAAQKALNARLAELQVGGYFEPTKLTVAEYLERWLTDYARPSVSDRSFSDYARQLRRHLVPALGHLPLAALSPLHIQQYLARAREGGRLDGQGGLGTKSVHMHFVLLREALRRAVRWDLIARNPCDRVDPPPNPRREWQVLDEDQSRALLAAAFGLPLYLPILLAMATGLRKGEVLALGWDDFDGAAIRVRRSMYRLGGEFRFKEPKTEKGRRRIPLPAFVVAELARHRGEQAQRRLLLGPAWEDWGLLCTTLNGRPMHPTWLSSAYRRLLERAGLPRVRIHDLRHGHATHLLSSGTPLKVVQERLGHASAAVTLDVYGHVLPGQQEEASAKVDRMLRGS